MSAHNSDVEGGGDEEEYVTGIKEARSDEDDREGSGRHFYQLLVL